MSVTHMCPTGDESIMPCCGRPVFEAPKDDRITTFTGLVTCGAKFAHTDLGPHLARHQEDIAQLAAAYERPTTHPAEAERDRALARVVALEGQLAQVAELAKDLCDFNGGHGDFLSAGKSLRAILTPDTDA